MPSPRLFALLAVAACLPPGAQSRRLLVGGPLRRDGQSRSGSAAGSAASENASAAALAEVSQAVQTRAYNESEAVVFAHYARMAYCESCTIRFAWTCGSSCSAVSLNGIRLIGPGRWSRVTGFVGELPQRAADGSVRCVVSFSGSSNLWHWATNLNFAPRAWEAGGACRGGCRVHGGFADAWHELEPEVYRGLEELGCKSTAVTGHSLGGAIATLAAFRIRTDRRMVADPVYLFGAPRVGNQLFAEAFFDSAQPGSVPAWRIVHYKDPVPRMPFDRVLGFRHHPTEVYYSRNERQFTVCSHDVGEDRACSLSDQPVLVLTNMLNYHAVYMGMNFNPLTRERGCRRCPRRGTSLAQQSGDDQDDEEEAEQPQAGVEEADPEEGDEGANVTKHDYSVG